MSPATKVIRLVVAPIVGRIIGYDITDKRWEHRRAMKALRVASRPQDRR